MHALNKEFEAIRRDLQRRDTQTEIIVSVWVFAIVGLLTYLFA